MLLVDCQSDQVLLSAVLCTRAIAQFVGKENVYSDGWIVPGMYHLAVSTDRRDYLQVRYIYMYTHTHVHIYVYIHICVCACVCTCQVCMGWTYAICGRVVPSDGGEWKRMDSHGARWCRDR